MSNTETTKYVIRGDSAQAVKAMDNAAKSADKLSGSMSKAKKETSSLSSSLTSFVNKNKTGITAIRNVSVVAFGAMAYAIKQGTDRIVEYEGVVNRLTQIHKTSRKATDEQVKSLIDQALALEKTGVASKELIINAQAQLATFDMQTDSIRKLTPAIVDYVMAEKGANATIADAQALTNGLAQALQGNFASLTKSGFVLDDHTKKLLSNGTEMERATALASVLESTYKGFNASLADTSEGLRILRQREMHGLVEVISKSFLPIMTRIDKFIVDIAPKISNWIVENQKLASIIAVAVVALTGFVAVLTTIGLALPSVIAGITLLLGPVGWVIAAVTALGAAWATNFLGIQDITAKVIDTFKKMVEGDWRGAWENMKEIANSAMDAMDKATEAFGKKFIKSFSTVMDGASNQWINGFAKFMDTASNGFINGFTYLMDTASNIVINGFVYLMELAYNSGANFVNMLVDGIDSKINAMIGAVANIGQIMKDWLGFASPTKKGPGSEADKWMPNFVKMLIDGINQNKSPFEKTINDLAGSLGKGFSKKKMDELKGNIRSLVTDANKAFNDMGNQIQKSIEKLQGMKKEMSDLRQKMKDVIGEINNAQLDTRTGLAGRAVSISNELEEIKNNRAKNASSGDVDAEEEAAIDKKVAALEAELAFIKETGITEQEIIAAKTEFNKTEAQHIIDRGNAIVTELQAKKDAIAEEITVMEGKIKVEYKAYEDLKEAKKGFAKDYHEVTMSYLSLELTQADTLIQKFADLAEAKARAQAGATGTPGRSIGGPVIAGREYTVGENGPEQFVAPLGGGRIIPNGGSSGGSSVTVINNFHNPVIRDEMDMKKIGNFVKDSIMKDAKNYRLNIA